MRSGILSPDSLFYRVFHDSPVGMAITTLTEGRYVEVNAAFARLLGAMPEELRGQKLPLIGLENDDERGMVLDVLRRLGKLGNVPLALRASDGEPRAGIASVQLEEIDSQQYLLFLVQDITAQERAQEALRSSEQRFRLFFQSVPSSLLVVDDATRRIVDVNIAACDLYGYQRQEFTGLTWDDLLPGSAVAGNGAQAGLSVEQHRLKDGSQIDVDVLAYSFVLDDRPVTLHIVEDITEQRAIQSALRNSEERLRIIADMATDAIWERDIANDEVTWSSGLASMFGYVEEIARPHDWWIRQIHPDDRPVLEESVSAALASGDDNWSGEYRFLRADGKYANVLDRGHVIRDDAGQPIRFIGAMVDVTEHLHLAEAAALAALEERQRLARDLHDSVTQSLYSISLMAEATRRRAEAGDQELIVEFINRLGELSRQALRQLRLLVYELRPGVLAQEGLAGALRHRLEAVEKRAGLDARLVDESTLRLPLPLKAKIFRAAQEALNHSLKYAAAQSVRVYLRVNESGTVLQISDDGVSFDQRAAEGAADLEEIRRHVAELEGELTITSISGEVVMRFRLPNSE